MAKKTSNLKIVQERTEAEKKKWSDEYERWEKAEKDLLITASEAKHRVQVLHDELEAYRDQLEAVPFDIPSGDMSPPICLDGGGRKTKIYAGAPGRLGHEGKGDVRNDR